MSKPKRHNFVNAKLVSLSFDRQNLSGADFSDAYINNCSFKQANLAGANFQNARIGHTQNTTRRKITSALVTAGTTLVVLLIARFNNSAFATASMLSVMLVIVAQLYKYTPALAWLWAATLPATFYLSVASLYRAYRNFSLGLTPIAVAYIIVAFMFVSVTIVFSMKLLEGIRSTGASFLEANLTHANFSHARIEKTSFLRAKLNHVKWFNTILSGCTFSAGSAPVETYQAPPKLQESSPEKPDIRIT
jgi:uncharacterized protein YjbI with pentapeptide repeats